MLLLATQPGSCRGLNALRTGPPSRTWCIRSQAFMAGDAIPGNTASPQERPGNARLWDSQTAERDGPGAGFESFTGQWAIGPQGGLSAATCFDIGISTATAPLGRSLRASEVLARMPNPCAYMRSRASGPKLTRARWSVEMCGFVSLEGAL